MPARRLLMRKIREVLRLRHEQGLSHQAVARVCALGVGTVNRYLRRAVEAGLGWPLPVELDDAALEARLFPRAAPVHERVRPECAHIHRELKRDGVTLQLLWEEYAQVHPHGYRYTQFCEIYRQWARRLRPSMRQVHRAGEKTFIDFSGKRPALVDPRTGEVRRVELFVAVLGPSSFTYTEATATQQLPDWVDAHVRMVEYFGGTTALWVPDQLKSAVTRPCRYEPGVNRTYEDLAAHYGAVVVPARPRRRYDGQPSTVAEHMPSAHRAHAEWTPSRLIRWAEKVGPATGELVARILAWPTPATISSRPTRPPPSASRSASACSSTPSGRPASNASCSGGSAPPSCAIRRRLRPSTSPTRGGSTASRS